MIVKLLENKQKVFIVGLVFSLFLLLSFLCSKKQKPVAEILLEEKDSVETVESIKIDIKGAVKNPGVYELEVGTRVKDAIEKSGGILENASLNTINLSKKLEDEMVIIIYTDEEIKKFIAEETRTLKQENTCICPKVENNACVKDSVTNHTDKTETSKQVSLNDGSKTELESLPGIGASKAEAIIIYRTEHGKFQSIEEIKNVSGIGEATFAKIKQYLTL